jgi:hypothetical protein
MKHTILNLVGLNRCHGRLGSILVVNATHFRSQQRKGKNRYYHITVAITISEDNEF